MEQRTVDMTSEGDTAPASRPTTGSPTSTGSAAELAGGNGILKVWIDQDLCTGDGICTDHAPEVFVILEDGIAYCTEGDKTFNDPGGSSELATVSRDNESHVIHAAGECPGECIFIEFEELLQLDA